MHQVADWLDKLGLGQYAERFAENDISFSVLPDLTDQHLKEIGVSLGHRLQLLRAIAELTSGDKQAWKPAVASAASARPHCRAPPSHRDVLGFGRIDGTVIAYGPRGPTRGHFRVPEVCRRDRAALRGVRSEVHGRRRARLLRLSASTRATPSERFGPGKPTFRVADQAASRSIARSGSCLPHSRSCGGHEVNLTACRTGVAVPRCPVGCRVPQP